ncbi:MAG TPA: hypothetical protein VFZ18_05480 [Longimicrobiaceae bacterium]
MRLSLPRPRIHAAAAVASLFLHALLLLAIGRWYGSAKPPLTPPASGSRVVAVDVLPAAAAPQVPQPQPPMPAVDEAPASTPRVAAPADTVGSATPPVAPAAGVAPLSPSSGRPLSAAAALRGGFSDPRLLVVPDALRPPSPPPTMQESFRAALEADDEATALAEREALARRQITLFGRKVTVFGDSSKVNWRDLSVILSGKRAVLPVDGREWEDLQMRKQNVDFVRDSILRERVQRVTR